MRSHRYLLLALAPLAIALSALLFFSSETTPRVVYGEDAIPGHYIVVLKDNVDPAAASQRFADDLGFQADSVYEHAVKGFAAEMSPADAQRLAEDSSVKLVAADQYVHADIHTNPFQTLPTGVDRIDADQNATAAITGSPGPNLDVDVAVIDTGVMSSHVDLNVAGGPTFGCSENTHEDDNGHGTHVAGTIAAIDDAHGVTGVAPGARIWAVKVLNADGAGPSSCVIEGIDWVTQQRQEYNDGPGDGDPGIDIVAANMSLGGPSGAPPSLDPMCTAINSAVAAGVMFAVAAGNNSDDASNYSPAHCTNPVVVSAFADYDGQPGGLSGTSEFYSNCPAGTETVEDDTFACFSDFGTPVDIAAPGVDIISTTSITCDGIPCYATMSGTSMATPHVTGALLLLHLEGYNGPADAASVMSALSSHGHLRAQSSACGFTGDPDSSAEPVLYLGTGCGGSGTPTPSPTATPTRTPTRTPSPTPSPTPTPRPARIQGDADCDSSITTLDVLRIMLYIDSLQPTGCWTLMNVDCNSDIDVADALVVIKYLLALEATIPADCTQVGQTF